MPPFLLLPRSILRRLYAVRANLARARINSDHGALCIEPQGYGGPVSSQGEGPAV